MDGKYFTNLQLIQSSSCRPSGSTIYVDLETVHSGKLELSLSREEAEKLCSQLANCLGIEMFSHDRPMCDPST